MRNKRKGRQAESEIANISMNLVLDLIAELAAAVPLISLHWALSDHIPRVIHAANVVLVF